MSDKNYERLSDHILKALAFALVQKDLTIADILSSALEMSMTRAAGGKNFSERREFTSEVENVLNRLEALRKVTRR